MLTICYGDEVHRHALQVENKNKRSVMKAFLSRQEVNRCYRSKLDCKGIGPL